MKGGVAQGRVPVWGEVMREPLAKRGPVVAYTPKLEGPCVWGGGISEEVPVLAWASPSPSCFCSGLATAWSQGSAEKSLSECMGQGSKGMSVKGDTNLHLEYGGVCVCVSGCARRGVGLSQWSMLPHPLSPASLDGWECW